MHRGAVNRMLRLAPLAGATSMNGEETMRLILAVATILLVAGCVDVNDTPVNTRPATVTKQDHGFVQTGIIDDLKDPGSAQTRNLVAYDLSDGQGRIICGQMNGKNSFGAYVGYQPFYIRVKDGAVVSKIVGTGSEMYPTDANRALEGCTNAATGQMKIGGAATAG